MKVSLLTLSVLQLTCCNVNVGAFTTTHKHATSSSSSSAHYSNYERRNSNSRLFVATPITTSGRNAPIANTNGDNQNKNKNDNRQADEVPPLGTIARMLPKESFDIDTKTSLFYFGVDMAAVVACLTALNTVVTSDIYHSLPILGQAMTVVPLQVLSGFAMWCMW